MFCSGPLKKFKGQLKKKNTLGLGHFVTARVSKVLAKAQAHTGYKKLYSFCPIEIGPPPNNQLCSDLVHPNNV